MALAMVLGTIGAARAQTDSVWFGGSNNWSVPANWTPNTAFPNNAPPTTFNAAVNGGAATLTQNITIQRLTLGNATIATGAFTLRLNNGITWTVGTLSGTGTIELPAGSTSSLTAGPSEAKLTGITLINAGAFDFAAGNLVTSGGVIQNPSGATFTMRTNVNIFEAPATNAIFNNAGALVITSPVGGFSFDTIDTVFNNTGSVTLLNANAADYTALSLAGGGVHGGSFALAAGSHLEFGGSTTLNAGVAITGEGTAHSAGQVSVAGNVASHNLRLDNGTLDLNVGTLTVAGSFTQFGGALRVRGGTMVAANPIETYAGTITGNGTLSASITTRGTIAPGEPIGALAIQGSLTLASESQVGMEIGGIARGTQHDALSTTGSIIFGGTLNVALSGGFQPALGNSFDLFDASATSGTFSAINLPALTGGRAWSTSQLYTTGRISVVPGALTPIEQWRFLHFGISTDTGLAANDADPDHDGVKNLLEYGLSADPLVPTANGLPTAGTISISGSNYLTLTFTRPISATDVSYLVEVSSDFAGWLPGSSYSNSGNTPSNANTTEVSRLSANGVETIVIRDNTAISAAARRFMRVKISHP